MPAGRSFVVAAEDAVKRLRDAPVDMAYVTAADQPPAQVCQQVLAACDVYVGVIGFRYGSAVPDRPAVSYTELEFDTAAQVGIPRLVFLVDEHRAEGAPGLFLDREHGDRQVAFRRRLLRASRADRRTGPAGILGDAGSRYPRCDRETRPP